MKVSIKDRIILYAGKLTGLHPSLLRRYNALRHILKTGDSVFDSKQYILPVRIFDGSFLKIHLRSKSSDIDVFEQIFIVEEYGLLIQLLKKFYMGREIGTMVDLGANIGLASIYLCSFFKIDKIIAVEAEDKNHKMLIENLKDIPCEVIPIKAAIWNNNSVLERFSIRDKRNWSVSFRETRSSRPENNKIIGYTLPQLVHEHGIKKIDVLKIDIEGAEFQLMESKKDFLDVLRITNFLAIEIHDEVISRIEFTDFLRENFKIYGKGDILFGINHSILK